MTAQHGKGLPAWVDLAVDDIATAKEFYEQLFGWQIEKMADDETFTYYTITNQGASIGGMMGKMNPYQPTAWLTYFETPDIEQSIVDVNNAGGKTYLPATDMPGGKFTFASGLADEPFGLVEGTGMFTAFGRNLAGDLCWFELEVGKNFPMVAKFYEDVFESRLTKVADEDTFRYYTFGPDDQRQVGGFYDASLEFPSYLNGQLQWAVTFVVEDVNEFTTRLTELGGTVDSTSFDTPYGDFAMVHDPQGAFFVAMRPEPSQPA